MHQAVAEVPRRGRPAAPARAPGAGDRSGPARSEAHLVVRPPAGVYAPSAPRVTFWRDRFHGPPLLLRLRDRACTSSARSKGDALIRVPEEHPGGRACPRAKSRCTAQPDQGWCSAAGARERARSRVPSVPPGGRPPRRSPAREVRRQGGCAASSQVRTAADTGAVWLIARGHPRRAPQARSARQARVRASATSGSRVGSAGGRGGAGHCSTPPASPPSAWAVLAPVMDGRGVGAVPHLPPARLKR